MARPGAGANTQAEAERRRQEGRVIQRQITSRLPRLPHGVDARRVGHAAGRMPGRRVLAAYRQDDGDGLATIIAYNALFSMLPLLLFLFTALSLLVRSDAVHRQVVEWVQGTLPGTAEDSVIQVVERGRDNLGELSLITLAGIVLGGSRLFSALDRAFSTIYRVPRRSYVERKLLALAMVPLVTLLLVVAALAATLATVMLAIPDRLFATAEPRWVSGVLTLLVSYAVAFVMAWLMYSTVPRQPTGRLPAGRGAATAAMLLVLLNQIFPLYMRFMGGISAFGGAFALVLVLMLWLYLLGQIIVIGAEVNAVAAGRKER